MTKLLRFVLKLLTGTLAVFFALIGIYIFLAVLLTIIPVNSGFHSAEEGVDVYVETNGVHTDLVVPVYSHVTDWTEFIPFSSFKGREEGKYLAFGWGEEQFYVHTPSWADLKFSTAFRAMFMENTTALHVSLYKHAPRAGKEVKVVRLSSEQYSKLAAFIKNSFAVDNNGRAQLIPMAGYGSSDDNFFKAKGRYSFYMTCNTWTNKGLKEAGVKNSVWAPFDESVFFHLE